MNKKKSQFKYNFQFFSQLNYYKFNLKIFATSKEKKYLTPVYFCCDDECIKKLRYDTIGFMNDKLV